MLFCSQHFKEDIMLRTNTQYFSEFIHILKYIDSKCFCFSRRRLKQTSQHRECSSLSCSIMTKKCENLSVIHCHISSFNSYFISKLFDKVFYLKTLLRLFIFLLFQSFWHSFKIHIVIIQFFINSIALIIYFLLSLAYKIPWLSYTVLRWDYLF